ncbi:hypothetical protein GCM10007421_17870 [Halopseudomonas oceani]|uniref:Uncharacterized protein n=1 Tax=Halopseudomonas oceani TaxID=1708783 RepID=A0A2P4EUY7_9GAMM|nr:hypothetical protein [Halopseudomonas oceani]POB03406.1 hypothetical protein C1949_10020 [Halopseudomonas oceani]GGE44095.1 hypothetical protein GCM10007421_17870 [Halopseudomonas oceani]
MLIPLLVNLVMLFGALVLFFAACGIANNCDNLSPLENKILDSSLFVPGPLHLVTLLVIGLEALSLLQIQNPRWLYLPAVVSIAYWITLMMINARKNRYLRAD